MMTKDESGTSDKACLWQRAQASYSRDLGYDGSYVQVPAGWSYLVTENSLKVALVCLSVVFSFQ